MVFFTPFGYFLVFAWLHMDDQKKYLIVGDKSVKTIFEAGKN